MILFIDNYDSFTYNLVQYCGSINPDIKVVRNDEITVDEIRKLNPTSDIRQYARYSAQKLQEQ